jgi:TRAP transporter TAXI family solute receptor
VATCLIVAGFILACSGGARSPTRFLSIATGGVGGVYYPYGGAIARVISQHVPGVQATVEVTGGAIDNLKLLQQGKVDLAFTLADTLAEARAGSGPFKDTGPVTARSIASLYTNFTHVVVRQGSGIARIADLRGKVVSMGSPGSGTELVADRVLSAAGLDPRADITRQSLGVADSVGAMKDGKLDAFVWSGGVPTPSVQDLAATPGFQLALLPHADLLPALERAHGGDLYRAVAVPAGTYRGVNADVPVIGVLNLLVASASLDDGLVQDIMRAMLDHRAALEAAHPEAKHLSALR